MPCRACQHGMALTPHVRSLKLLCSFDDCVKIWYCMLSCKWQLSLHASWEYGINYWPPTSLVLVDFLLLLILPQLNLSHNSGPIAEGWSGGIDVTMCGRNTHTSRIRPNAKHLAMRPRSAYTRVPDNDPVAQPSQRRSSEYRVWKLAVEFECCMESAQQTNTHSTWHYAAAGWWTIWGFEGSDPLGKRVLGRLAHDVWPVFIRRCMASYNARNLGKRTSGTWQPLCLTASSCHKQQIYISYWYSYLGTIRWDQ